MSETDQRDYENIKKALKELRALGIKDPEIQEKIKKLEDRLLAFDDMATRAGTGTTYRRAVGAGEKKRVKVIQDELTEPSAATRQMKEKEKEVDDETKYTVGGKSMSRKELLEELAKADKAMGAMEVKE